MTSFHPGSCQEKTKNKTKQSKNSQVFWLVLDFFFFLKCPSYHLAWGVGTQEAVYFIPLRSIWFAAMSMTLMINAMAKAQIRLLRTHVCFSCCVGLAAERFTTTTTTTKNFSGSSWCKSANLHNPPPTVDVHVAVGTVQVALLRHDDVLDVFHGEVVAERVVKQPLQLVHGQFLHVALEGGRQEGRKKKKSG